MKTPLLYPTSLEIFRNTHEACKTSKMYKVVLDALPSARNVHTKNKTHYRAPYNYARLIAGIESFEDAKEVLLFNSDGEVMDVCHVDWLCASTLADHVRRVRSPHLTSSAMANGSHLRTRVADN